MAGCFARSASTRKNSASGRIRLPEPDISNEGAESKKGRRFFLKISPQVGGLLPYYYVSMKNLIAFKACETNTPAFATAKILLFEKCFGIHETVAALVKAGASELYAKSVVVHLKAGFYASR